MKTIRTNNQEKGTVLDKNTIDSEMRATEVECINGQESQLAFETAIGDMGSEASLEWLEEYIDFDL